MLQNLKDKRGFTIIEVVIVLAIASLILLAVFLAVGGAQRTQRDQARKSIAGRTGSALENFASNNNGSVVGFTGGSYFNGITDPDSNGAPAPGTSSGAPGSANQGVHYALSNICNGTNATTTGASTRNYAILYWSENSGGQLCTDNH